MNLLKTIFDKQYELNKRILKERHGKDYDELCDQNKQDKETVKSRVDWILNYNRAQIHESIELEDSLPWKWWKDMESIDWETEGVWVSKVERASWVDVAGLSVGDLILQINGVEDNKRMDDLIDS